MTITENGTNYPNVLGPKNIPTTTIRSGTIGDQAIAVVRGETPIHLAQGVLKGGLLEQLRNRLRSRRRLLGQGLPPRGTGLLRGTARTGLLRGGGRRLSEAERLARHKRIYGKNLSVHSENAIRVHNAQGVNNIPTPWIRPTTWPNATRLIGRLPSVIGILHGPERTVLGKRSGISVEL